MIAMKREVAVLQKKDKQGQVFRGANVKLGNWRQVTVQNNCPCRAMETTCCSNSELGHTRESVQSPLVVLVFKSTKRRRLFLWQVK